MPGEYEKQLEDLLQVLRSTLAAEVERIASVGSFAFDPVTKVSAWSGELRRIVGVPETEQPGLEALLRRVHPDDREMLLQLSSRPGTVGEKLHFHQRLLREDGEVRHLDVIGETIKLAQHPNPLFVGTVRDITEPTRAETLIAEHERRLGEMRSEVLFLARQSAMATMAATLAHEINQPLTAIANYAAVLERLPFEPAREADLKAAVAGVGTSALRAGTIMRRMRALMERGEVVREKCDMDDLIRKAATHLTLLRDPGVTLDLHCGRCAWIDPVQIEQVLANLVRNGLEAGDLSGTRAVTVTTACSGPKILVSVEDRGPGIPEDALRDFFESRASAKPMGMGIGLSICKTIIEAHRGSIWAENIENGARISFSLPVA
ncbi:PAS domain S-box-containing protein [Sphingomonas naasensis]|uniref:histidine kinase n=1 Tax=Sphingomonas naasensis TaxID=1344951 RepID=A0A4S1WKW5_9SPHN|nr:ATP-binding protein [Sphingomonas naasensis]NIJ21779.1 PAS domain S-box-containing protein [Sphingomonas naasensis]TGX42517.1 PAS domain-containing sensor histidine kinase [Sphingomonas naasensis]